MENGDGGGARTKVGVFDETRGINARKQFVGNGDGTKNEKNSEIRGNRSSSSDTLAFRTVPSLGEGQNLPMRTTLVHLATGVERSSSFSAVIIQ